jgi:hypothetical protein
MKQIVAKEVDVAIVESLDTIDGTVQTLMLSKKLWKPLCELSRESKEKVMRNSFANLFLMKLGLTEKQKIMTKLMRLTMIMLLLEIFQFKSLRG